MRSLHKRLRSIKVRAKSTFSSSSKTSTIPPNGGDSIENQPTEIAYLGTPAMFSAPHEEDSTIKDQSINASCSVTSGTFAVAHIEGNDSIENQFIKASCPTTPRKTSPTHYNEDDTIESQSIKIYCPVVLSTSPAPNHEDNTMENPSIECPLSILSHEQDNNSKIYERCQLCNDLAKREEEDVRLAFDFIPNEIIESAFGSSCNACMVILQGLRQGDNDQWNLQTDVRRVYAKCHNDRKSYTDTLCLEVYFLDDRPKLELEFYSLQPQGK
jgi:hypothetical protein